MNKFYLFRDLSNNENLEDGKSYHAAGYVGEQYEPTRSGKEFAVVFFNPFTATVQAEWRESKDVELFEVDFDEWAELVKAYEVNDNE